MAQPPENSFHQFHHSHPATLSLIQINATSSVNDQTIPM